MELLTSPIVELVAAAPSNAADDGASTTSVLVFAGGVMASIGAVVAAVITTRAADKRHREILREERQRAERRLEAEHERIASQLKHERDSARRTEESVALERIIRIVGRNVRQAAHVVPKLIDGDADLADLNELERRSSELREEVGVLAIRLQTDGAALGALREVSTALGAAIPNGSDLPLDDQEKAHFRSQLGIAEKMEREFWKAARKDLLDQSET